MASLKPLCGGSETRMQNPPVYSWRRAREKPPASGNRASAWHSEGSTPQHLRAGLGRTEGERLPVSAYTTGSDAPTGLHWYEASGNVPFYLEGKNSAHAQRRSVRSHSLEIRSQMLLALVAELALGRVMGASCVPGRAQPPGK